MLATFCLRLACGLMGSLLLLSPAQVNPRFYRTHFLTTLGLLAAAMVIWCGNADWWLLAALALGIALAFLGSLLWSLEGAPGGRAVIVLTTLSLAAALGLVPMPVVPREGRGWFIAGEFSSAFLLGTATTAMLMGHSYLIAPSMSLTPLMRLLAALFLATAARLTVAGVGLWAWTDEHSLATLNETVLWLPLRWGLGFAGPFVLGLMAREAAKIRSTQSATGILYVVVIFCFLGELTSQLLLSTTGFNL